MKRFDLLINQTRSATENEEFNATSGIDTEEFIRFGNDAQGLLQSSIQVYFPSLFQAEKTIQAVVNQEAYSVPDDAFLGSRIDLMEYSTSGNGRDYYVVFKGDQRERLPSISGTPSFYIRRSTEFLLEPKPQQAGTIRVTYQKSLPDLDIRRAVVNAAVLDTSTNTITSLTLDTTQTIDDTAILEQDYITIVDKDGVIKMRRIPVTAVSTTSGIVTVDPSFVFQDGETIPAGSYVCRGKESTTHSQLPDICERYLVGHMDWKILKRDSSDNAAEQGQELQAMLQDILASFREPDGDVNLVPILDGQFLTTDW